MMSSVYDVHKHLFNHIVSISNLRSTKLKIYTESREKLEHVVSVIYKE